MIRIVDQRDSELDPAAVVPRASVAVADVIDQVQPIVSDVADRGSAAVAEWSEKLDGTSYPRLRVPKERLSAALQNLDPRITDALTQAAARVRKVHTDQLPRDAVTTVAPGGHVTQRWIPVQRVGLYVPGGQAVYASSVIMNVVAAQVAGVESIAVVSPPQVDQDGLPAATVLAACALLGVDEVYAVGGAQAVALLAYGAQLPDGPLPPVDMITGPGNVWVTAAKRLVMGTVGIDAEAGPTEVMIIADETADAAVVASDLVSQAEHDTLAAAVLVTPSESLAEAVVGELARQVPATKHSERIRTALAGEQSAIILVQDLPDAVIVANAYGAEHLEIQTRDAREWADRISNAGAIFVGRATPVSLGDYAAGSNHVLPTGGTAAHSSGLGVGTFLRSVQVVEYDDQALAQIAEVVQILADSEDLPAHGAAVSARTRGARA